MTKLDLPYLMRQRDRQGRWVWYVRRRKGAPKIRLQGSPGDDAFLTTYHAALAREAPGEAPAADAGTFGWLCRQYLASPEFGELAALTRAKRRNVLTTMLAEPITPGDARLMGHVPIKAFTHRAVRVLRDRKKDYPEAANARVRVVSAAFKWAIEAELAEHNPARDIPALRPKNRDGHHTWTLAEVARYRRRHEVGTKARLALEILLHTGVRRSDAVRLGRPMVEQGQITWTVAKTGQELTIPLLPQLAEVLAATPLTGTTTWLVTQYGKPFTAAGFSNWFRNRCDEAGLPHCTAHGLRKAGATIAAEAGATGHELRAIFGWQTHKQVERYTRKADQKRLAAKATRLLATGENET